jgi:hypothetical protein
MLADKLSDPTPRRHHAEEGERASVEYLGAVDLDGELAVMTLLEVYLEAEAPTQVGRHPGGLDARHSVAAATHSHGHGDPPREWPIAREAHVQSGAGRQVFVIEPCSLLTSNAQR